MGTIRELMRRWFFLCLGGLLLVAGHGQAASYIPVYGGSTNFGVDGNATTSVPFRAEMRDGATPSINYVSVSTPRNVLVSAGSFYTPVYTSATVMQTGARFYVVACRGNQNALLTATLIDYDPATGDSRTIDTATVTVGVSCGSGRQYSLNFGNYSEFTLAAGRRLKVRLAVKQTTSNTTDYVRIHDASVSNNSMLFVGEGSASSITGCVAAGTYSSPWGTLRTVGSDGKPRTDFDPSEKIRYEFASYLPFSSTSSSKSNVSAIVNSATSSSVDCTRTLAVNGKVYSYTTGTSTTCYKGSYPSGAGRFYVRDISDSRPYARSFVNITPETDTLKFYSDAAYSVQTDTFRATDTVYAILTSPALNFTSIKSLTLYDFNNGGTSLARASTTVSGNQIKFSFVPGATRLANGAWGAINLVTYQSNTSGKTRTYVRNIRRLDAGCVTCLATAPVDVVLQAKTTSSVTLAWTPDNANNAAYRIYRDGVLIKDGLVGGSYTDSSLSQGTIYLYTVRGINGANCESDDSNAVNAETSSNPGAFNVRDFGTRADGSSPAVDNKIRTKISGSSFPVEIVATESGFKTWTSVTAELWDASDASGTYDSATNCLSSYRKIAAVPAVSVAASGSFGKATFPAVANAYRNVVVKAIFSGSPAKSGCSVDHFAIRPAVFKAVEVTDADWLTAGTARSLLNVGKNHRAGRPFRIKVEAQTVAGAKVTNYDGQPELTVTALLTPTGCASCLEGAVDPGTWSSSGGVSETLTASYNEVGSFTMTVDDADYAAVDLSDGSTASELTISSTALNVGSFVPDAFLLSEDGVVPLLTGQCTGGNFLGQVMNFASLPKITAVPVAYSGDPAAPLGEALGNLSGSLARSLTASSSWTPVAGLGALAAAIAEDADTPGQYLLNLSGTLGFSRPAKPDATTTPFCLPGNAGCGAATLALALDVSVRDTYAEGNIVGSLSASGNAITNTSINPSGPIGYGQLRLFHTFGTGLQQQPVAPAKMAEIQVWNGSAFQPSAASCSNLAAGQIAAVYNKITCADTRLRMPGAISTLNLSAIIGTPKNGWVDLTWNLGTAAGNTCLTGTPAAATSANAAGWLGGLNAAGTAYDANPTARARIGVRGARRTVYLEAR